MEKCVVDGGSIMKCGIVCTKFNEAELKYNLFSLSQPTELMDSCILGLFIL